jgi:hypothetical protein
MRFSPCPVRKNMEYYLTSLFKQESSIKYCDITWKPSQKQEKKQNHALVDGTLWLSLHYQRCIVHKDYGPQRPTFWRISRHHGSLKPSIQVRRRCSKELRHSLAKRSCRYVRSFWTVSMLEGAKPLRVKTRQQKPKDVFSPPTFDDLHFPRWTPCVYANTLISDVEMGQEVGIYYSSEPLHLCCHWSNAAMKI